MPTRHLSRRRRPWRRPVDTGRPWSPMCSLGWLVVVLKLSLPAACTPVKSRSMGCSPHSHKEAIVRCLPRLGGATNGDQASREGRRSWHADMKQNLIELSQRYVAALRTQLKPGESEVTPKVSRMKSPACKDWCYSRLNLCGRSLIKSKSHSQTSSDPARKIGGGAAASRSPLRAKPTPS